ncbi:hypothetical protein IMZ48_44560 [Candidatus Bathyarchaeota archaeon]|nr:hypothetical protein [Candidatus Bathyarchaeota archaeon]
MRTWHPPTPRSTRSTVARKDDGFFALLGSEARLITERDQAISARDQALQSVGTGVVGEDREVIEAPAVNAPPKTPPRFPPTSARSARPGSLPPRGAFTTGIHHQALGGRMIDWIFLV